MKKPLLSLSAMAMLALSASAQAYINPIDRIDVMRLEESSLQVASSRAAGLSQAVMPRLDFSVRLAPGASPEDLLTDGLQIINVSGSTVLASGDITAIRSLMANPAARSLSVARLMNLTNNVARSFCGSDDVTNGTGLPHAYTGKDVLIGTFDVGVEFNHINFKDASGKSRIKKAWIYTGNGNPAEYDDVSSLTTEYTGQSHGTHTLGISSGSYKGNNLHGVAPEANILVACGSSTNYNIIDAAKRMMDYAESVNKPLVINFSLGWNLGPHDGTTDFNLAMEEIADRGAIIVFASGNEGYADMAVKKDITKTDTSVDILLAPIGPSFKGTVATFAQDDTPFDMSIDFYDTKTRTVVASISAETLNEAEEVRRTAGALGVKAYFPAATSFLVNSGIDEGSGRFTRVFDISNISKLTANNINIFLHITGCKPDTRFEAYINTTEDMKFGRGVAGNVYTFTTPGPDGSISDLACGKKVISAGSFTSRPDADNWGLYKNVSYFSSWGTLIDGRKLPHVVSPGHYLISSINAYDTHYTSYDDLTSVTANDKTYYWGASSGTSMAAPFTTGTIATWLQANPKLTYEDVANLLATTSTKPETFDGSVPWGGGLINGLAGIRKILGLAAIDDILADGNSPLLLSAIADNVYEVFAAGRTGITAEVFAMDGTLAAKSVSATESATLDLSGLAPGMYVISVKAPDFAASTKAMVK